MSGSDTSLELRSSRKEARFSGGKTYSFGTEDRGAVALDMSSMVINGSFVNITM
jgi:hypothetical protein